MLCTLLQECDPPVQELQCSDFSHPVAKFLAVVVKSIHGEHSNVSDKAKQVHSTVLGKRISTVGWQLNYGTGMDANKELGQCWSQSGSHPVPIELHHGAPNNVCRMLGQSSGVTDAMCYGMGGQLSDLHSEEAGMGSSSVRVPLGAPVHPETAKRAKLPAPKVAMR